MKTYKKCLSIFLAIITILTAFSAAMPVFAAGNLFTSESTSDEIAVSEEMTSKIVSEVADLREEYVKHFVCEDGSYIAATYNDPVHYKEDGQWKEIDNSLKLTADMKSSSGKAMYTPKAGTVDVKIPQNFESGQKVSATNKGYTISFGANHNKIIYQNKPVAVVKEVEDLSSSKLTDKAEVAQKTTVSNESEITTFNNEAMTVENQAGAVVYEDVFSNADLEYIVSTNSIKENIIVNEKQNKYTYSFDMDFGELVPVVNEDNSIRLVDPENTDETIFYIAAPYMYDANGTKSYDIDMSLVEKDGKYIMTLQADAEWINAVEREFPVIIDPTVYLSFNDVFVMDGITYKNTTQINDELRVGRNLANLTRTYIKPTLPNNIPAGSYINSAYLTLLKDYYYQLPLEKNISVRAYDCYDVKSWNPTGITWENQPYSKSNNGYSSGHSYLSSVEATSSRSNYTFGITNAVRRWLNGGINNGIMLASSNESSKTQIDFHSSRASNSSSPPVIYINYTAPALNISTWGTDSQASEKSFSITTGSDWTAYTNADWISLSATSGTSSSGHSTNKIIVTENTSVKNRTGTVTVKSGNTIIGTVKVTQYGAAPYLTLDDAALSFEAGNNKQTLNIESNTTWSFGELPDWITVTPSIGSKNSTVEVEVAENHGAVAREYTVTVTADTVTQTVNVSQTYDNIPPAAPNLYEEGGLVYISAHSVDFDALKDGSEHIEYKLGNGEWIDYEGEPLSIIRSYDETIYARTCDVAGNISEVNSLVLECELGEYMASYADIAFGEGVFPVPFERTYSSTSGWFFSFEANVAPCTNGYVFTDFYGEKHHFLKNSENKYVSSDGDELELNAENYAYKVPCGDITCYFGSDGKLAFVKNSYISALYTWTDKNLNIEDQAGNISTVRIADGKPQRITIVRYDDKNLETKTKIVSYQWDGDNLTKFVDTENIEHNYAYTNGLLTQNETEAVAYSSDGRVKRISQPNGAFVKYTYDDTAKESEASTEPGAVTVSDSKGVTDTIYYADGFTVSSSFDNYSDKAVYAPENISNALTSDNISLLAYVCKDEPTATDVESAPDSGSTSDLPVADNESNPLYVKNDDGSYTFYGYDEQNRVVTTLEVAKGALTVTDATTLKQAEAVAKTKITTAYVDDTENVSQEITLKRNSENVFVNSKKTDYTYFENDDLQIFRSYDWKDNSWKLTLEELYDVNGNIILSDSFTYGEAVTEEKTTYTYDENNRLTEQLTQKRTGDAELANFEKVSYTYNAADDILAKTAFKWMGNDWYRTYGEVYEYNDYGNNTKKTVTTYQNTLNPETESIETTYSSNVTEYVYDVWNQPVQVIENKGKSDEKTSSVTYDNLGRTISATEDGKTIAYTYDILGRVTKVTEGKEVTAYTYSEGGNLTKRTNPNGTIANYSYDSFGNLTAHDYNGYAFTYNTLGSILTAKAGEQGIVSYTYSDDTKQNVLDSSFGNGQSVKYEYNSEDEITAVKLGDVTKYSYTYNEATDENGDKTEWTELTDYVNNLNKVIEESKTTVKDIDGNFVYSIENVAKNEDDSNSFDGTIVDDSFITKYDNDIDRFFVNSSKCVTDKSIKYDEYGRLYQTANQFVTTEYGYDGESDRVTSLSNSGGDIQSENHSYTYDENGRIKSISSTSDYWIGPNHITDSSDNIQYSYDADGQLISSESDTIKNAYSYDSRGNILNKKEYAITIDTDGEKVYTEKEDNTYAYDTKWKDKLTSFNGQSISYDASGNPTSYLGHNLTWTMGRQLASFDDITYTYDENGMRASKTVNGKTTRYYYDGTRLIKQIINGEQMTFLYDRNNELVGFYYCNQVFLYVKNLQGDITGIISDEGFLVARYVYDDWGNCISVESGYTFNDIANVNPFRYRGYYYDSDTGLYYLQSRYYDPEVCRFINADDAQYIGTSESEVSYNPFAYCENEPVASIDLIGFKKVKISNKKKERAYSLIGKYANTIMKEADYYKVDPCVIAGVIYVEQAKNYNFIDSITDGTARLGVNTSVGLGQVRLKTAIEMEKKGYIQKAKLHSTIKIGIIKRQMWEVPGVGYVIGSYNAAVTTRLENDKQNIKYVAAYLSYLQNAWKKAYPKITNDPGVLATLYNIGVGKPHSNPKPSADFGKLVEEAYDEIAYILLISVIVDGLSNQIR